MSSRPIRALRHAWRLLRLTIEAWIRDNASLMAAALAFYSIVSVAPLAIIVLSVAGFFYDPQQVQDNASRGLNLLLGSESVNLLDTLMARASLEGTRWTATAIGFVIVFYGSTRVFGELQRALRAIWQNREQPPSGFHPIRILTTHLFSFVMVLGAGVLWLFGAVSATLIEAAEAWVTEHVELPSSISAAAPVHTASSVVLLGLAVSIVYRLFSEGRASWRAVWPGALLTALLLVVGQQLIGRYLGRVSVSSVYGAAGSLLIVLFWFYYSWMIFLLGAELTKVYVTELRLERSRARATE